MLSSNAFSRFLSDEQLTFSDVCAFWNISPRSTARQFAVQTKNADKAIEMALEQITSGVWTLPGNSQSVSWEDLERLRVLSSRIREFFREEIAVIESRTDERKL